MPELKASAPSAPGASSVFTTLKARRDFLAAAKAKRAHAAAFVLQARHRDAEDHIRVGYTCSKKVGNAVARNRAKRRLREAARHVIAAEGRAGWDYVLIGRKDVTARQPFDALLADVSAALQKIHGRP